MTALTLSEELLIAQAVGARTLVQCEAAIKASLTGAWGYYLDIGDALAEIKIGRLYTAHYTTFEEYCQDTWGFTRMTAGRYIKAANVTKMLQNAGKPVPKTQREALALMPPKKERKRKAKPVPAAEVPAVEVPTDATPVPENPTKPTPTMRENLLDMFQGLGLTVLESMNPGRWLLDDLTADQMRRIAMALGAKQCR
jgi:hypothetical protein